MLKIALLLVKIYVLVGKKGISELVSQVAAKPTVKLTMGQLLLFFLWNFSSFFSYVGGIPGIFWLFSKL